MSANHERPSASRRRPKPLRVIGFPWLIFVFLIPAVFPSWFFSTPAEDHVGADALIGIASIAAVVWTGGLIAFQLRQLSSEVAASLSLLRIAFLVPLIALVGNGPTLRFIASLSGFYMFRASIGSGLIFLLLRFIMYLANLDKFKKNVPATLPKLLEIMLPELAVGIIADIILIAGCLSIFVYPSHLVIGVTAIALIFIGARYVAEALKPGYEEKLGQLKDQMDALRGTQPSADNSITPQHQ